MAVRSRMRKIILVGMVLILLSSLALADPGQAPSNRQYPNVSNPFSATYILSLNQSSGTSISTEKGFPANASNIADPGAWHTGYIGNALDLDGSNDNIQVNYTFNQWDRFAACFWVNSSDTDIGGGGGALFGENIAGAEKFYGYISAGGVNDIRWLSGNAGGSTDIVFTGAWDAIDTGTEFHHLCFMKAAGNLGENAGAELWVDGVNWSARSYADNQDSANSVIQPFFGDYRNDGTAAHKFNVDEIVMWSNSTDSDVKCADTEYPLCEWEIFTMNHTNYSFPFVQPSTAFVNISQSFPANNTQYDLNFLNVNASVNSTNGFTGQLFINSTLNQTRTFSGGKNVFVSFNVTFPIGTYLYQINVSETLNATRNDSGPQNTFFVDTTEPQLAHNFINGSVFFRDNLTGQFNFTDNFILWSYNISVDGSEIFAFAGLNVTSYSFNLSYNVSALTVGSHELSVRFADGHTAKELGGNYDFRNGLFNDYTKYDFWDKGWIHTESKDSSIFDEWSSTRYKDRYTQLFEPGNPSSTVTLIEESNLPIQIVHKPGRYNDDWIIVGNHWKDYVLEGETNTQVSIKRITDYKVEVTISGIKNTNSLQFSSIGDLNVVTQAFNFTVVNSRHVFDTAVSEFEYQSITLELNNTADVLSTDARLFYNGSEKDVVKTELLGYDRYVASFVTTGLSSTSSNSETKFFDWMYMINGTGNNESGNISDEQTVFRLGVDNCTNKFTNYTMRAYNITLRDETTDAPLNGTIDGYFETWIGSIGNFSQHNLSWYHDTKFNSPVGICIFPNESIYFSYAQIEYSSSGYQDKLYYFDNTTFTNQTKLLNLYLTNGTTQVTLTVRDFNDNPVENAIIKVLTYDVGTDTSTVTETLSTDSDGVALAQMVLNTQFYRFIIEYNKEVVLATEETKITSTTKNFRVDLVSDYIDNVEVVNDVEGYIRFINSSLTFDFIYNDASNSISEACLEITRIGLNERFQVNQTCVSATAGTISLKINENVSKNTYEATGTVVLGIDTFVIDKLTKSFDYLYKTFGLTGIFVSFMVILTLVLVGVWNPSVSIAFMIVGFFIVQALGVFHLSWGILIAFIINAGIAMYKVSQR